MSDSAMALHQKVLRYDWVDLDLGHSSDFLPVLPIVRHGVVPNSAERTGSTT